jgi:hypothetical protein
MYAENQGPLEIALKELVCSHLLGDPPSSQLLSLTGSLLWALNFAHYKHRRGNRGFHIWLIDTWKIPQQQIQPAWVLTEYLKVQSNGKPWHDNPYHEYLVEYKIPRKAILGDMQLDFRDNRIRTLIPALINVPDDEGLHRSLEWCRFPFHVAAAAERSLHTTQALIDISQQDFQAAWSLAGDFGLNRQDQLAVMTMFLSLRPRKWDRSAWTSLTNFVRW